MTFQLPDLPFAPDALEPHMSANTLGFHHGKHHKGYIDKLNAALEGSGAEDMSLEDVIAKAAQEGNTGLFNNAAQTWNHSFFWQCLAPNGGGQPEGELAQRIEADFGSYDEFRAAFKAAATGQFGSGWAWLVLDGETLKITTTGNADTPLVHGQHALLTCDVWEHAYYLDYQNDRPGFVDAFLDNLVNWDFAASCLSEATSANEAAA